MPRWLYLRLATQAALAQDYIELRTADEKKHLLDHAADETTPARSRSPRTSTAIGVAGRSDDPGRRRPSLDPTRAQAVDTGVQRAQLEHAIAVLLVAARSRPILRSSPAGPWASWSRPCPGSCPRTPGAPA